MAGVRRGSIPSPAAKGKKSLLLQAVSFPTWDSCICVSFFFSCSSSCFFFFSFFSFFFAVFSFFLISNLLADIWNKKSTWENAPSLSEQNTTQMLCEQLMLSYMVSKPQGTLPLLGMLVFMLFLIPHPYLLPSSREADHRKMQAYQRQELTWRTGKIT